MWQVKKAFFRVYQQTFRVAMCVFDWSEPTLLEGPGAIRKLPEFIKSKGLNKVLVVTDKGLMGIHLLDSLFEELDKAGVEELAAIPPKPMLVGKLLGSIQGPLYGLAYVLQAKIDKENGGAEAPAEA